MAARLCVAFAATVAAGTVVAVAGARATAPCGVPTKIVPRTAVWTVYSALDFGVGEGALEMLAGDVVHVARDCGKREASSGSVIRCEGDGQTPPSSSVLANWTSRGGGSAIGGAPRGDAVQVYMVAATAHYCSHLAVCVVPYDAPPDVRSNGCQPRNCTLNRPHGAFAYYSYRVGQCLCDDDAHLPLPGTLPPDAPATSRFICISDHATSPPPPPALGVGSTDATKEYYPQPILQTATNQLSCVCDARLPLHDLREAPLENHTSPKDAADTDPTRHGFQCGHLDKLDNSAIPPQCSGATCTAERGSCHCASRGFYNYSNDENGPLRCQRRSSQVADSGRWWQRNHGPVPIRYEDGSGNHQWYCICNSSLHPYALHTTTTRPLIKHQCGFPRFDSFDIRSKELLLTEHGVQCHGWSVGCAPERGSSGSGNVCECTQRERDRRRRAGFGPRCVTGEVEPRVVKHKDEHYCVCDAALPPRAVPRDDGDFAAIASLAEVIHVDAPPDTNSICGIPLPPRGDRHHYACGGTLGCGGVDGNFQCRCLPNVENGSGGNCTVQRCARHYPAGSCALCEKVDATTSGGLDEYPITTSIECRHCRSSGSCVIDDSLCLYGDSTPCDGSGNGSGGGVDDGDAHARAVVTAVVVVVVLVVVIGLPSCFALTAFLYYRYRRRVAAVHQLVFVALLAKLAATATTTTPLLLLYAVPTVGALVCLVPFSHPQRFAFAVACNVIISVFGVLLGVVMYTADGVPAALVWLVQENTTGAVLLMLFVPHLAIDAVVVALYVRVVCGGGAAVLATVAHHKVGAEDDDADVHTDVEVDDDLDLSDDDGGAAAAASGDDGDDS